MLSKLKRIDDAWQVCRGSAWRVAEPPEAAMPPIWEVRAAAAASNASSSSSSSSLIEVIPTWPIKCVSGRSRCGGGGGGSGITGSNDAAAAAADDSNAPPLRYCVVDVRDAVVLPSGLVVNRTHRFDLASSFLRVGFGNPHDAGSDSSCEDARALLTRPDDGDDEDDKMDEIKNGAYLPSSSPSTTSSFARGERLPRLISTRMLWGDNPFHDLFQALPLATLAANEVNEKDATTKGDPKKAAMYFLAQSAMSAAILRGRGSGGDGTRATPS